MKEQKKRALRVLSVVALSAITLTLSIAHEPKVTAQAPDEAAVREVLLKSALAFEKNDVDLITKAWANDESVTVFESGHANYGWADYRDHHLLPEMKEMNNTKYTLFDIKVKVSGNTAWATFKYAISADIGTRHVEGAGLGTSVLEKRGQDWKIVHWHSSAPRRPANPAATPTPRP
ncbi:MAG TPA: nuclear transport factor 2 family protein [Pyrinomonadaceae bacterium]|nr:nuclear transport factor 2 family protein [Pyrinomonadaceae bacterium]